MELGGPSTGAGNATAPGGSADFVRKLYRMLEDPSYHDVVRWNADGDSFIVFDNADFTKNILPKHFKHSNFASFVRQLNKYDFHKVRNTDESGTSQYAEGVWEFQHPCFQQHNKEMLDNIKRKPPTQRKPAAGSVNNDDSFTGTDMMAIERKMQHLHNGQVELAERLLALSNSYNTVIAEVQMLTRRVEEQKHAMQQLVSLPPNAGFIPHPHIDPSIPPNQTSSMANGHHNLQMGMNGGEAAGFHPSHSASSSSNPAANAAITPVERAQRFLVQGRTNEAMMNSNAMRIVPPQHDYPIHAHDQVSPHLATPQSAIAPNGFLHPNASTFSVNASPIQGGSMMAHYDANPTQQYEAPEEPIGRVLPRRKPNLRKTSEIFNPIWHRSPRVLLVEDDAVCRRIGFKFLTITNCQVNIAENGTQAVDSVKKSVDDGLPYDIILMDIVMPKLDGCTATQILRREHPDMMSPPIIAMTSNIMSDDISKYFNVGMIDVLPKPFTKYGLLAMLQKFLPKLVDPRAAFPPEVSQATTPAQDGMLNADELQSFMEPGQRPKLEPHHSGPHNFRYSPDHLEKTGDEEGSQGDDDEDSPQSRDNGDMKLGMAGGVLNMGIGQNSGDEYTYMTNYGMEGGAPNDIFAAGGMHIPAQGARRVGDMDEMHDRKRMRFGATA